VQTLGPYQLYQRLGMGATAEVFLAAGPNPRGSELLAVKVMLESLADRRSNKESFLKEARTSALLRHKNVVEIYEVGEVAQRPFIAMELVRGWSLSQLLKKMKEAGETFAVDEACELVRQAALGLHYIHDVRGPQGQVLGLVHRDVSPQNLILDEEGVVKVVDFGLAKATANATLTTGLKGKIRYMAPEALKGEGLDRRIDVFGLGAILWELVCDKPLHPGPSEAEIFQQAFFNAQPHPDEVKRGLPRAVVEVLLGAVARDKGRRYATAWAMAEALSPLCGIDVNTRLAARIQRHFERLPKSKAELDGQVAPVRVQGGKAATLPAPPGKVGFGLGQAEVTEPFNRDELFARARAAGKLSAEDQETLKSPVVVPRKFETNSAPTTLEDAAREPSVPARPPLVSTDKIAPVPEPGSPRSVITDRIAPQVSATVVSPPGTDSVTVASPRTNVEARPLRRRGVPLAVVAVVAVALLLGGFALARRLFPAAPDVVELPTPPPSKWKSDLPPEDEPELAPGPEIASPAAESPKAKGLTGRPPRKGGKGKVRFLTAEPAEVFIGKKRYGLTNELVTLPSGRHRVELIVPGGEKSAAIEVDVVANTSSDLRVTLER
jgi:eukaryotic-like serine/threonine-protein kinase